ncbi:MAG TPA: Rne/Rng family ribonuclease [Chthonomonadaceae bacterium]|nr:Rne/Rng family ribonuclease [Chthonomonadaceae bacterium]
MAKEIVVNVGERETRIAVLEEGKLVELHIERAERVVGSIYKCRVANVLPGMDAAFVDIGLERNAFLYVGDVLPTADEANATETGNGAERPTRFTRGRKRGQELALPSRVPAESAEAPIEEADLISAAEEPDTPRSAETESDVEQAIEEAAALEAIAETGALGLAISEEEEELDEDEEVPSEASAGETEAGKATPRPRRNLRRSVLRQQRIKDVLHVGQELLVQVIKGPRSTKGARVSTRISLPGRYLVLMPESDNLGVSRKIEDQKERDRLKKIGEKLREPGFGLIIRTEAEEKTEQELRQDRDFLIQTWRQIQESARKMRAPALVQQDLTLLFKTIRDVFGSDVSKLVIDDPAEYEKANELLERISPRLKGRVHLYDGAQPIFDHYGLETEIERLLKRKVYLKSGGSLVIDETEALTVIDVNTSKFVGSSSLAETIIKTNLDAANEIARQLRLRDIGGIIVIDFIDMSNPRDKQAVLKALETALKKDRSRTKISNISPLGLVEMTRKRTGETLTGFLTDECPYCKGRGYLPSAESVSLLVERDLRRQVNSPQNAKKEAFLVTCHPEVAELLIGPDGATIEAVERQLQRAIYIRCDEDAHIEKYAIEPGDMAEFEKNRLNYRRAQVVECRITRSLLKEPNKCIGWADGYMLDLDDGHRFIGQKAKARILDVHRSYAVGQIVPGTNRPLES